VARGVRLGAALALVAALLAALAAAAGASTVANTNDSGPGSLRQAISEASPGETIVVPAGTYTLTSGELAITKSLTITGAGAAETIVRSGGAFRVVSVTGAKTRVKLAGLTIRDGKTGEPGEEAQGGGIFSKEAELTLEAVVVTNNVADASGAPTEPGGTAEGGGIYSSGGTLTLTASTISSNTAKAVGGDDAGGGIAEGGGVKRKGPLTATDTAFTGNVADARGGQAASGKTELQSGGVAEGGGLYLEAEGSESSINGVALSANTATAAGGPGETFGGVAEAGGAFLHTAGPSVAVSATTVSGNKALAPGGTGAGALDGVAEAGGLYLEDAKGTMTLTNDTVTGNAALANAGKGGVVLGGGLVAEASKGTLAIASTTIDANTAEATTGHGGDLFATGAGITLQNTIVSGGQGPAGSENCSGTVESLGHNIDSRDQCGFHASGDKVNANSLLGPLQGNGGPVQTEALTAGSPAIDSGTNVGCPATDARGVVRPQGAACDIGAFELAPPSASTSPATGVGPTSATLQGTAVNPAALPGSVFFQLGTTTAYGLQVAPLAPVLPTGAAGQAFSAAVAVLAPGTLYHFRALATNSDGAAAGGDQTFTTAVVPPRSVPVPPVLSRLAVSPSSLRATPGKGASIAAAKRRGATVSYLDSEAAKATFTVLSPKRGYRVGRRCGSRRPTHGAIHRCTRYVSLGSFAHTDVAGTNKFRFTGRVAGRPLAAGSYRLSAVARNAAGQTSTAAIAGFKITR